MIIQWPYYLGLIPLLILIFPHKRSTRVAISVISAAALLYIWSGMAKAQKVELMFVGQALQRMSAQIKDGQGSAVCNAMTQYTDTHTPHDFDGFRFNIFIQNYFDPKNYKPSEQWGPGYPPQGVGSPDP